MTSELVVSQSFMIYITCMFNNIVLCIWIIHFMTDNAEKIVFSGNIILQNIKQQANIFMLFLNDTSTI